MQPSTGRLALTIDYAFKKFFVSNPDLLCDFVSSVLATSGHPPVVELEILNPELPGPTPEDKNVILDIRATDSQGRLLNIEMQACIRSAFTSRIAFYAFRLYSSSLKPGEDYSAIPPVFSINLLDFIHFPGLHHHRCFRLRDVDDPTVDMRTGIEFHFLELPKLRRALEDLENPLDEWAAFIRRSDELTEEEMATLEEKNPVFGKARKALDIISQDELARIEYDLRQVNIFFNELDRRTREKEARAAGRAEGAREIARRLKERGTAPADIAEITGLSQEEVETL